MGEAFSQTPDKRIMRQKKEPRSSTKVERISQYLVENAQAVVLLPSQSPKVAVMLELLKEQFPLAVHFRADGPDAVFDWREGEPILIENFEKLSRRTRQFILGLGSPLVLVVKNPLYWQLALLNRAVQVIRLGE